MYLPCVQGEQVTRAEWDEAYQDRWGLLVRSGRRHFEAAIEAREWTARKYGERPDAEPTPATQEPETSVTPIKVSWITKLGVRIGAKLGGKLMPEGIKVKFNRWAPIAGGLCLVASAVLKLLGQNDLAGIVDTVAAALGLTAPAWFGAIVATVAPAAAVVYGSVRKVLAARKK